jgi:NADPH2:quinone reductase
MLAAFYERCGPAAEVLQLAELPEPQPGPGEVRVRLRASGVNPNDVKSRAGVRNPVPAFPRVVPHSDGAGVIDTVGAGVDAARLGERVWVWNAGWQRADGSAAQAVALPAAQAVRLPDAVAFEAGACLGIPALTALHALLCEGGVAGQRVLVAGGAGAVGHYAVQMARRLGAAQVIASVSGPAKAAIARAAGADHCVDYRSEPLAERIAALTDGLGVDRVIEVDAAANLAADIACLKAGGRVVVYGSGRPEIGLPFFPAILRGLRLHCFIVFNLAPDERAAALAQLGAWLEAGALDHRIDAVLPLAAIARAHERVESGQAVGNVVLRID